MDKYHIKLTLQRPLLGTVSRDPETYAMLARAAGVPEEQLARELEILAADLARLATEAQEQAGDEDAKGPALPTGFLKENGQPILLSHVLKGYLKDAASMLGRVPKSESKELRAFKKVVDGLIFPNPWKIPLRLPPGATLGRLDRPLRASTPQGERVAIARSEYAPAGTVIEFDLAVLGQVEELLLREWLDYGCLRGLGQWRNAGWGVYTYEMERIAPEPGFTLKDFLRETAEHIRLVATVPG